MKWSNLFSVANCRLKSAFSLVLTVPFIIAVWEGLITIIEYLPHGIRSQLVPQILKKLLIYRLTLYGAILFVLLSIIIRCFCPHKIREYKTKNTYRDWCINNASAINPYKEFSQLINYKNLKLEKLSQYDPTFFPLETGITLSSPKQYCNVYAPLTFELVDRSYFIGRFLSAIFIVGALTMMYLPLLISIMKALGVFYYVE